MKAGALADVIEELAKSYVDGGILQKPASMSRLLNDLRAAPALDIDDLHRAIKKGDAPKPARKTRTKKPPKPVDEKIVAKYLKALESAGLDEANFREVLDEINNAKKSGVRATVELREISAKYTSGAVGEGKKDLLLDAIRREFSARMRHQRNRAMAASATPF